MTIRLVAAFTLNAASGLVISSIVLPVGAPVPRPTPAPRPDLPARTASIAGLKATACDPAQADRRRTSNWQYAGVNYFDGWTYDGHGAAIGGVSVDLWNGAASVDPASSGDDYTYVWSMLTVPGGPGAPFVQVGSAQYPDGSRHTMVQYLAAGGRPQAAIIDPPEQLETYSDYQVLLNYRPGVFSFFVGGRDIGRLYDVLATFTPTMAEVYGETHSLRSQMPGGSATDRHEDLIASRYWRNGWHSFFPAASIHTTDVNGEDMSAYFGHSTPTAAGDLSIWDKAC